MLSCDNSPPTPPLTSLHAATIFTLLALAFPFLPLYRPMP